MRFLNGASLDAEMSVLVGANASGFKRLGAQLFVLVGDHVYAEREFIHISLLTTQVKNPNLWVRDTTVKS